jgi:hypothetical protein
LQCQPVWLKGDIEVLERVKEKAVKMASGLKSTEYADKCAELGRISIHIK